ncbi:MAG: alcohol dehydrogenase [Halobacteriales archaeon]|jgi:alcohol dehydrogenase
MTHTETMRAVVFQGENEPMRVETIDRPEADADKILVETEACGVCRRDWHAWRGDWEWIGMVPTLGLVFGMNRPEPSSRLARTSNGLRSATA